MCIFVVSCGSFFVLIARAFSSFYDVLTRALSRVRMVILLVVRLLKFFDIIFSCYFSCFYLVPFRHLVHLIFLYPLIFEKYLPSDALEFDTPDEFLEKTN